MAAIVAVAVAAIAVMSAVAVAAVMTAVTIAAVTIAAIAVVTAVAPAAVMVAAIAPAAVASATITATAIAVSPGLGEAEVALGVETDGQGGDDRDQASGGQETFETGVLCGCGDHDVTSFFLIIDTSSCFYSRSRVRLSVWPQLP